MSADLLFATRAKTAQPVRFPDMARYVLTAAANVNAFAGRVEKSRLIPATSAVYRMPSSTEDFDPERFGAGAYRSQYSFDHGPVIGATILSKSDDEGNPRSLLPEGNRSVPPCHYLVEFVGVGAGRPFIHAAGALVSRALKEDHAHESQFKHMLLGYDWEQFTDRSDGTPDHLLSRIVSAVVGETAWADTVMLCRMG